MATLKLTSLRCIRKQDVSGKDEPRLSVDSRVVWNGVIEKGQTLNLAPTSASIGTTATIVLHEMNGSKAKQIGSTVNVDVAHPRSQPVEFKTSGTHYELFYDVD